MSGIAGRGGRRRLAAALVLALTRGGAARAAELSFGLGYDGFFGKGSGAATASLQATTDPIWQLGPVGFDLGASAEADTEGDL